MGFQLDEVLNVEIKLGSPKFSVDEESMGDFDELIYPTHTSHSYIVLYICVCTINNNYDQRIKKHYYKHTYLNLVFSNFSPCSCSFSAIIPLNFVTQSQKMSQSHVCHAAATSLRSGWGPSKWIPMTLSISIMLNPFKVDFQASHVWSCLITRGFILAGPI